MEGCHIQLVPAVAYRIGVICIGIICIGVNRSGVNLGELRAINSTLVVSFGSGGRVAILIIDRSKYKER